MCVGREGRSCSTALKVMSKEQLWALLLPGTYAYHMVGRRLSRLDRVGGGLEGGVGVWGRGKGGVLQAVSVQLCPAPSAG